MHHCTIPSLLIMLLVIASLLTGLSVADEFDPLPPLKTFHTEIPVARDGTARCIIAVPDGAEYAELGRKLADAIGQVSGAAVPVRHVDSLSPEALAGHNFILLGYFANNPLMERLYDQFHIGTDLSWPGPGGYVIRTVHDPVGTGTGAVCLSGADLEAVAAAVDDLLSMLPARGDIVLPHTIKVVLPNDAPAYTPAPEKVPDRIAAAEDKNFATAAVLWSRAVSAYFRTGNPEEIEVFLGIMPHVMKAARELGNLSTIGGLTDLFSGWDAMEEAPQLTPEQRADVTAALWELTHRCSLYGATAQDSQTPPSNNHSARAGADMARYWHTYYGLDVGGMWTALNIRMRSHAKFWRPSEDCPGYGGSTMADLIHYAISLGYDEFWESDVARQLGDYGLAVMNNLGGHAGFGDTSAFRNPGRWPLILRTLAWKLQDGRYLAFEPRFSSQTAGFFYSNYTQDILHPEQPEHLIGIHVVPLPDWVYQFQQNLRTAPAFVNPILDSIPAPPREHCFDKITFRTSTDAEDQYLILGGISHGYHAHPDGNAIIEFTDNDRYCLWDSGYFIPDTIEHTTLVIFRDGMFQPVPRLTGLDAMADLSTIGATRTYLSGYNGTQWQRNIIWNKEQYFLVVDEVQAVEPGNYSILAVFKVMSDVRPEMQPDRVHTVFKDRGFNLISNSYTPMTLARTLPLTGYGHAVQQNLTAQLAEGEKARFINLLYADDGPGDKYDMVPADEAAVIISSPRGLALAGIGPARQVAGVQVDATHFYVAEDSFALTAARALSMGQVAFSSDRPVNIEVSLGSIARAVVQAEEATTIRLPATGDTVQLDGRTTAVRQVTGGVELDLQPGEHRLSFRPLAERMPLQPWGTLYGELSERHEQRLAQVQGPPTGEPMQPAWQLDKTMLDSKGNTVPAPIKAMIAADLTGDGRDEVISLSGSSVQCHDATGEIVWEHTLEKGLALSVDAYDLNADGHQQVVVGDSNAMLTCFDHQGNVVWSILTPADRAYPERDDIHGKIEVVGCADINADGFGEIVVGSGFGRDGGINWHAYGFDHTGKHLWTGLNWAHVPTSISFVPMADGTLASLISTTYNAANLFASDGTKIGILGSGFHSASMTTAVGDMDGDGVAEMLAGSRVGGIHCASPYEPPHITLDGFYGREGKQSPNKELWARFLGAEVTKIALGDLTGDGKLELVGGSKNFHILALDATGEAIWTRNVGEGVMDLALGDITGNGLPEIVAGTQNGRVLVLDASGEVLGSFEAGGVVKPICLADLNGDGKLQVLAGTDAGSVYGDIK